MECRILRNNFPFSVTFCTPPDLVRKKRKLPNTKCCTGQGEHQWQRSGVECGFGKDGVMSVNEVELSCGGKQQQKTLCNAAIIRTPLSDKSAPV